MLQVCVCVCVCVWERERERQTDRQTETVDKELWLRLTESWSEPFLNAASALTARFSWLTAYPGWGLKLCIFITPTCFFFRFVIHFRCPFCFHRCIMLTKSLTDGSICNIMWNANSFLQHLNLGLRVHFLPRQPLRRKCRFVLTLRWLF